MFRETLGWWLVVEAVGLVALPLAFVLFRRLPDRGYAFAKPVGVLLGGYLFWLALTAHLLPNRPGSIVWCYLALAVASGLVFRARKREILEGLQERIGVVIAVEVVFTLGLFTAAYLRSYVPQIDGTEKPMDFMFLNTVSRSRYYPPADPWLAGFSASYYYFGYVLQGMLGKLAAVPTSVAFNLGLAGTAALAASAAFGLAYDLVALGRRATFATAAAAGGAAVALVLIIGNLEGVLEFAKANGVGSEGFFRSMGIANLAEALPSPHWYPSDSTSYWWWWRATRVCPDANCIMEFPFFSFLLGDLHPHVMAVPFVLTTVALGLSFWRSEVELSAETWSASPGGLVLPGILVGGLGFLNAWDLPTFGFLVAVLVFARNLRGAGDWGRAFRRSVGFVAPLALVAVLAYVPFYATFHSQAAGLDAVSNGATRPLHAALIWLPLAVVTVTVPLVYVLREPAARTRSRLAVVGAVPLALLAAWAVVLEANGGAIGEAISARGWNWLSAGAFAAAFCVSVLSLWHAAESDADGDDDRVGDGLVPLFAMTAVAALLVLGAELFFIKDSFGSRLNTVFKLYYQAWLLLGVSGGFGLYWLAQHWQPAPRSAGELLRGAWGGVATLALIGALLYPLGATLSRTFELGRLAGAPTRTLDGMAFVSRNSPDQAGVVDWLRRRAGTGERIVEAVKTSYSDASLVSARTGVPTVLGWPFHELQWGRPGAVIATREADVNEAYSTVSLEEALAILRKYRVTYVVVGNVERAKYPPAGLAKFTALQAVYTSGTTSIYRVPFGQSDLVGKQP